MTALRLTAFAVLALAGSLAAAAPGAADPYQILGSTSTRDGALVRTVTLVQVGPHPLDRFKMVRLVKDVPPRALRGALLLLPPLGVNFSFYEQPDPGGPAETSIAGFFAHRNWDVYGYSPRFEGIPAGTCEAGVLDCSVMAGVDPTVQALNQGYCAALEALLAAGIAFDGVGPNVAQQVGHLARTDPAGPTSIPLFPPFLTNHQVLVLLFATVTPGPVTMPVPNYVAMNGSLAEDRLFFASEQRIFEDFERFNHYSPTALVRDISCALAGLDDQHVDGVGGFHGRVLGIGGGRGFGPFMPDQLAHFASADVTFLLAPEFAHIDHFMTPDHREFVKKPILRWLGGR